MTTAFIQKSLSPQIIGIFGLIVLISSLVNQHYRPAANAREASLKAAELSRIIRETEDRMVAIETSRKDYDDPTDLLALTTRISDVLASVDMVVPNESIERRRTAAKPKKTQLEADR